ncbi:hypothetical protein ACQ86N_04285 [Puia sp. P3]|uniref:hypothetical protein n=1 Tax=Puia sp. P3 TaxID=3423952 RepID=UPI003D66C5F3
MRKQLLTLAGFAVALTTSAQQPARLTTKDYERAESMLGYSAEQLVDRANVRPNWLPGDKFWYRILTAEGHEFVLGRSGKGYENGRPRPGKFGRRSARKSRGAPRQGQ